MYFFVNRTYEVGGLKTLALSEALSLKRKKKNVCLVCNYLDKETENVCCNNDIKIIRINIWSQKNISKNILKYGNNIDFVQFFGFSEFIAFYIKNNNRYKAQYYCVNPVGMNLFQKTKILKKVFGNEIKKLIESCALNDSVFFMDETLIKKNFSYYDIKIDTHNCTIINLPFEISDFSPSYSERSNKNILAVARAAFPFEGYLIGLLDELNKHYDELPPFSLTLISTGDDVITLKNKLDSVDTDFREKIQFIEGVDAKELRNYYKNSYLYIGMGQTILEAADFGVPSIVVEYDTFCFISQGFFHKNPLNLGSVYLSGHNGIEDIKYALELPDNEYNIIRLKTKEALGCYDENIIIKKIMDLKCNQTFKFSFRTKILLSVYFKLKQLYFGCI